MNSEQKKSYYDTDQILEEVSELTKKVVQTKDYVRYQKCLAKLNENPKLFESFNEFRRKSLALRLNTDEELYSDAEQLQAKYKNILMDPNVTDFLTAEQRINKMMRKIYDCLSENIPIDISYMD